MHLVPTITHTSTTRYILPATYLRAQTNVIASLLLLFLEDKRTIALEKESTPLEEPSICSSLND